MTTMFLVWVTGEKGLPFEMIRTTAKGASFSVVHSGFECLGTPRKSYYKVINIILEFTEMSKPQGQEIQ